MRTDIAEEATARYEGNSNGNWKSTLCECCRDEETCWWGTWCCWMLNARTTESFDLGSSVREIIFFWMFMLCLIMSTIIAGGLGLLLVGGIGGSLLALRRNFARKEIREKLGIYGSGAEDFWAHCCCSCCSVCQEAREAKFANLPARDYCSGELLVAEAEETADDPSTDIALLLQDGQPPAFSSLLFNVSQTSKFLVVLNLLVALVAFVILIFSNRAQNIVVLLLVFVQPVVVMYFMYWKWHQQYSSLDYVIKMFAVGFWFSTFQSIIIETIIQVILAILFSPFMGTPTTDDYDTGNGQSRVAGWMLTLSPLAQYIPFVVDASGGDEKDDNEGPPPDIFVFMLYQLATAYILAAGTEETMKHFAVRCCQFPAALKTPQAVLVYLFSAALGFATSENIEYVFGMASATKQSKISAMEEELFVLAIRVLMPVHLICSVLQASSLSTHLFGQRQMSLFWILLPAISVHGTYDFVLFAIGGLNSVYGIENEALQVLSIVLPLIITIGGAYWAYVSFKQVLVNSSSGWQTLRNVDSASDQQNQL